jgi:hypothetical protein
MIILRTAERLGRVISPSQQRTTQTQNKRMHTQTLKIHALSGIPVYGGKFLSRKAVHNWVANVSRDDEYVETKVRK